MHRNSIRTAAKVLRWTCRLALLAAAIPAFAQDTDDAQRGVARISVMDGQVSVKRGDAGEWVAGIINAPLMSDDSIATAPNSRAEVQFDSSNMLRIGANAQIHLTTLENQRFQMELGKGTVTFRVLRPSNANVEVDTPSVSVRPSRVGTYRVTVNDAGETQLTVRAGDVEVYTPKGSQWVNAGQTMLARGSNSDPEFQIVQSNAPDDWDRWNDQRDQMLTQASSAYQYVPPGVSGVEDMQGQGNWVSTPDYGEVWQPTAIPAGWAPYSCGRWVWADWYGWTWVDCASWGWAPFHYGRWFNRAGYGWLWYPGVIGVRHYWSPGLVAFFGWGGGFGFGFGFGNVGWVPLAPYEVFHPWWGRGYYGAGFASRAVVTNVNVYNTFRNARVLNGVSGVAANGFRGGQFGTISHLGADQIRTAGLVRGQMPIGPSAANMHFAGGASGAAFRPSSAGASHFFTHQQPVAAQHMAATESFRSAAAARASNGSDRFGGAQAGRSTANGAASAGAGQRFGSNGAPANGSNAPWGGRQSPATQNTRPGGAGQTPSPAGSWRRFGEPGGSNAPHNEGQQPRSFGGGQNGGRANINPPVVHERQGGSGYNSAPRQAPSYSAPQRQAPSYNPPARQSAPSAPRSGGGGGRPSGGGGGHSSGGGHRR